jgi:hypothetical protein
MEKVEEAAGAESDVLEAAHVYLLMSKAYRISRNRRAEWFFSALNTVITVTPKYKLVSVTYTSEQGEPE